MSVFTKSRSKRTRTGNTINQSGFTVNLNEFQDLNNGDSTSISIQNGGKRKKKKKRPVTQKIETNKSNKLDKNEQQIH